MRNVRLFALIETKLGWLIHVSDDDVRLPGGHMREGESVRYALSRIMRSAGISRIRLGGILAIGEREGRLPLDRYIDIYVRATIFGALPPDERWLADEAFEAHFPELAPVARRLPCAPYLGIIRRPLSTGDHDVS